MVYLKHFSIIIWTLLQAFISKTFQYSDNSVASNVNSIVNKFPNWPDPDDHWADIPVESLEKWKQWGQKSSADSSTGVYKRKVDPYVYQTPPTPTPLTSGYYKNFHSPTNHNYDASVNYRSQTNYASSTPSPYLRQNYGYPSVTTKQPITYQSGFFPSGLIMEFPKSPIVSHPDPEEEYNPLQFPTDNLIENEFQSFQNQDNVVPINQQRQFHPQPFHQKFHNNNLPQISGYRTPIQPKPYGRSNPNLNSPSNQRFPQNTQQSNENMVSLERASQEDTSDPYPIKPFVNFNIPVNLNQDVPKRPAAVSPHPYPFEPNQANIQNTNRNAVVSQQPFKPQNPGKPQNFPAKQDLGHNQPFSQGQGRGIPKRPRRNFQPQRRPPMNMINLDFGFRPPFVIGAPARPVRPMGQRQRGLRLPAPDNFEEEQFEQSSDSKSSENFEEEFYDDEFFKDPDFDNFDFSDFEEFEVYAEESEKNSTDEPPTISTNNYHAIIDDNDRNILKLDGKEAYEYNRDGLEMYKKRQYEKVDDNSKTTESRLSSEPNVINNEKMPFLEPDRPLMDYENGPSNVDPFKQFSYEPSNDNDFEEFDKYFNDFRGDAEPENPRRELQKPFNQNKEVSDEELALNVITDPFDTSDIRLNEKLSEDKLRTPDIWEIENKKEAVRRKFGLNSSKDEIRQDKWVPIISEAPV